MPEEDQLTLRQIEQAPRDLYRLALLVTLMGWVLIATIAMVLAFQ